MNSCRGLFQYLAYFCSAVIRQSWSLNSIIKSHKADCFGAKLYFTLATEWNTFPCLVFTHMNRYPCNISAYLSAITVKNSRRKFLICAARLSWGSINSYFSLIFVENYRKQGFKFQTSNHQTIVHDHVNMAGGITQNKLTIDYDKAYKCIKQNWTEILMKGQRCITLPIRYASFTCVSQIQQEDNEYLKFPGARIFYASSTKWISWEITSCVFHTGWPCRFKAMDN